jgi:hypothetical protein
MTALAYLTARRCELEDTRARAAFIYATTPVAPIKRSASVTLDRAIVALRAVDAAITRCRVVNATRTRSVR